MAAPALTPNAILKNGRLKRRSRYSTPVKKRNLLLFLVNVEHFSSPNTDMGRKKKCIRYIQGEGSCASPPSSDGSLLDSPPSSPSLISSPQKDSKPPADQTQPLSLTMKPPPLASHLSMPTSLVLLETAAAAAAAASKPGATNGPLERPNMSPRQAGSSSTLARPSPTLCHTHSLLPQPLSLVTKSIE
ncbi:hypothetical protein JZ751_025917 [Albula glossodonta]|uniref:Uncharacterized protein n=1 Tax=Albula glossodonta TaxID=121402 RepID=A0A8T2NL94_9TELE|nr:hypothetical protein JZ751_025917 [Albula glossodonta]